MLFRSREPGPVDEQPDLDLRVDTAFLAHADLAQRVLVLRLEMQRGDVVEDQAQRAAAGGVGQAGVRELAAVIVKVGVLAFSRFVPLSRHWYQSGGPPVTDTPNVALEPGETTKFVGWAVITGGETTVRFALAFVDPAQLLTTTE